VETKVDERVSEVATGQATNSIGRVETSLPNKNRACGPGYVTMMPRNLLVMLVVHERPCRKKGVDYALDDGLFDIGVLLLDERLLLIVSEFLWCGCASSR